MALVVVGALIWGGMAFYDWAFVRCADGVREEGSAQECVGVTDGSYSFDDSLDEVIGKIHDENRRVEDSGKPWVSIGYVEPMTLGNGDKGRASIRQELEGAHLAQLELNRKSGGHGDTPQIKLLPANPGRGSEQWKPVTDQLAGMTGGDHGVVAVAGFGQSLGTTAKAVEALRKEGLPMVGSTVTADGLSDPEELGFFRAVSPNSDQSSAAAKYLAGKQRKDPDFRVQVIKDRNANDIYSKSLHGGFTKAAREAGLELDPVEVPFVSRGDAVGTQLALVADKVCEQADLPDAVYFAGRGRDLSGFIEAAAGNGRRCPVTVYTGDDAVGIFFDIPYGEKQEEYETFRLSWKASQVKIRYTALAHPDAAVDIYEGTTHDPFPAFRRAYTRTFGGEASLRNGQAMLGHDAVLVIGKAIRQAAGPSGREKVNKTAVQEMLIQLNGRKAVAGVSGSIDFDDAGNPRDKPLPLVELRPKVRDEYAYLRVLMP